MTDYYLASAFARSAEMRELRDQLVARVSGARVTSRWIDLHPEIVGDGESLSRLDTDPAYCWRYARNDLRDVTAADAIVSVTGEGVTGGRHVEFGYALALGKRLVIVGPRENVFHTHPRVEYFPNWQSFLDDEVRRHS